MRKKLLILLAIFTVGSVAALALLPNRYAAAASNWVTVGPNNNVWSIDNSGTITGKAHTAFMNNFYLTDGEDTVGDYEVSATFLGSKATMSGAASEVQIGLVPWYIDTNNYVLAYFTWVPNSDLVANVMYRAKINGQWAYAWISSFANPEGLPAAVPAPVNESMPADGIDIKMKKVRSQAGDADIFYTYLNDTEVSFVIYRDTISFAAYKPMAGVYSYGESLTVTNFKVDNITADTGLASSYEIFSNIEGTDTPAYALNDSAGWAYGNDVYTVDASHGNAAAVLPNDFAAAGYRMTAEVSTEAAVGTLGVYAYYVSEYLNIACLVQADGDSVSAQIVGKSTDYSKSAIEVTEVSESSPLELALSEITSLTVEKEGDRISFYVNGIIALSRKFSEFNIATGKSVGLIASGLIAEFSGVDTEFLEYVPYNWYTIEANGKTYMASSQTTNSITIASETSLQISVNPLSDTPSAIYTSSEKYDVVSTEAIFSGAQSLSVYGIIAWAESGSRYVSATIQPSDGGYKVLIKNSLAPNIDEYLSEEIVDFTATNIHTVKTEVNFNKLNVYVDGEKIVDGYTIEGQKAEVAGVGVTAAKTDISVTGLSIAGYIPYDRVTIGDDITAVGARADSWVLKDEDMYYYADGGFGLMSSIAVKPQTEFKNFYFASKITMLAFAGQEWKVGFVPYYVDVNNYLVVWIGKWADGDTAITMHAKLNGEAVGEVWRETVYSYTVDKDAVNMLEVNISGDVVSVYLNQSHSAAASATFAGLSGRNTEGAAIGFNGFSIDAKFSDTALSTERIFINTQKPEIIKLMGNLPETAEVGSKISLPVFSAQKEGETVVPVITVYDPQGGVAAVESNKFTVSLIGTYTVRVTCIDSWGNHADPLEYKITVAEAVENPGETDNKPNNKLLKILLPIGIGLIVAGGGVAVFFVIKKKKAQKK